MKKLVNILFSVALAAVAFTTVTSCSEDEIDGNSIFNTDVKPLDPTSYSYPLDAFCQENFLEPYNMQFKYRMEDIMVDQQKNLVPVSYDRACEMAVLSKYMWYEIYEKVVCSKNPSFMKKYSPRIIHLVGSRSHNTSSNTITWGYASNGVQITLQGLNNINPANLYYLNKYALHTMHHEFSHLLQQTTKTPNAFNTISQGLYESASWQDISDSISLSKGFVTSYASESQTEDWVEVISCYITDDPMKWEQKLNTASYDWVVAEELKQDSIAALYKNKIETHLKKADLIAAVGEANINKYVNPDSVGFFHKKTSTETDAGNVEHYVGNVVRKNIVRDEQGHPVVDENGDIIYKFERGFIGKDIILQKLKMAKEWLLENFNYDLDALREEVQNRSYAKNPDGTFKTITFKERGDWQGEQYFGTDGKLHTYSSPYDGLQRDATELVNALYEPSEADPSKTLMETLLDMINQYKK